MTTIMRTMTRIGATANQARERVALERATMMIVRGDKDADSKVSVVTTGNPEYLSPGYLMGFESALIFVSTYMFFSK